MVNFSAADVCKKCAADLKGVVAQQTPGMPLNEKSKHPYFGIVAAVIVLAVVMVAFWALGRATRSGSPNFSITNSTPTAAPTPIPEIISSKNTASAKRALEAIHKLQSATEAGLSFMQYSERVLDTKAEVDAALRSITVETPSDAHFVQDIESAMYFYVAARDDWSTSIRNEYSEESKRKLINTAWDGAREQIKFAEALLPKE